MHSARLSIVLATVLLILAACGRVPLGSNSTQSPAASESPSAAATPLTIAETTLHNGEVALAYATVKYTASGGTDPYLWAISGGALPGGLSLSQEGVISGTPSAAGAFPFTIQVTDAAMATANLSGSIAIMPRLTVYAIGQLAATNAVEVCTAPRADHPCPSSDFRSAPFAAVTGGAPPYSYSVSSGPLPPGTQLNGLALTWVTNPAAGFADYKFTVAVTDSLGATATLLVDFSLYHM